MTTLSTRNTATGADAAAELTDGYHLVVEALKLNDVRTIYGVVGIPITDVARVAQTSGIRYIGFRHESDAGHAAAAAGFMTKKPGICLTVSAPGFLNGLVALANATTNCFPMVQISGIERAAHRRPEAGRLRGARPTRGRRTVRQGRLPGEPRRGHRPRYRPGDPYRGVRAPGRCLPRHPGGRARRRSSTPRSATLRCGGSSIRHRASYPRPRRWTGRSRCSPLRNGRWSCWARAPHTRRRTSRSERSSRRPACRYLPMSMAKGLLPDHHPQSVAAARSLALREADVVMLVGARLNWLLGHGEAPQWNPDAQFIQVDIEPAELDSNQPIAAPLVGDIGSVMQRSDRANQARIKSRARPRGEVSSPHARRRTSRRCRSVSAPIPTRCVLRCAARHPRRPARASRTSMSSTKAPTHSTSHAT